MRTNRLLQFTAVFILAASLAVFTEACRKKDKNNTATTTEETSNASDQAVAEQAYDDAQSIADIAAITPSGGSIYRVTSTTAGGCATVTHTPGTIRIDFGAVNCECADGRMRRGKIIVSYSGAYADSGSSRVITFDNYYQNDNKIEGSRSVTNMGLNTSGQPFFNVSVNGTITKTTGATISASYSRVRTWIAGYTTTGVGNWSDDVYSITGGGTITRTPSGGTPTVVTVSITAPLIVALNCRWIQAGTISYTIGASGPSRTLNYGTTPVCDNQAVVTLASGATATITLP